MWGGAYFGAALVQKKNRKKPNYTIFEIVTPGGPDAPSVLYFASLLSPGGGDYFGIPK